MVFFLEVLLYTEKKLVTLHRKKTNMDKVEPTKYDTDEFENLGIIIARNQHFMVQMNETSKFDPESLLNTFSAEQPFRFKDAVRIKIWKDKDNNNKDKNELFEMTFDLWRDNHFKQYFKMLNKDKLHSIIASNQNDNYILIVSSFTYFYPYSHISPTFGLFSRGVGFQQFPAFKILLIPLNGDESVETTDYFYLNDVLNKFEKQCLHDLNLTRNMIELKTMLKVEDNVLFMLYERKQSCIANLRDVTNIQSLVIRVDVSGCVAFDHNNNKYSLNHQNIDFKTVEIHYDGFFRSWYSLDSRHKFICNTVNRKLYLLQQQCHAYNGCVKSMQIKEYSFTGDKIGQHIEFVNHDEYFKTNPNLTLSEIQGIKGSKTTFIVVDPPAGHLGQFVFNGSAQMTAKSLNSTDARFMMNQQKQLFSENTLNTQYPTYPITRLLASRQFMTFVKSSSSSIEELIIYGFTRNMKCWNDPTNTALYTRFPPQYLLKIIQCYYDDNVINIFVYGHKDYVHMTRYKISHSLFV